MKFIPEPNPAMAESFVNNFLAVCVAEGCQPVLAIGAMAAIHPMGQAMLRECAKRGIPVELVTRLP